MPPIGKGKVKGDKINLFVLIKKIPVVGWFACIFELWGLRGLFGAIAGGALIIVLTYCGVTPEPWVHFITYKYEAKEAKLEYIPVPKPTFLSTKVVSVKEFRAEYSFLRDYQNHLEDQAQADKNKGRIEDFITCSCVSDIFSRSTEGFNWRIEAVAHYNITVRAYLISQDKNVEELEIIESSDAFCEFKVPQTQKGEQLIAIFTICSAPKKEPPGRCIKSYSQSVN